MARTNISYRKQTLFFRDWIGSGFSLVKDILENDNTIMTLKTICEKVGHKSRVRVVSRSSRVKSILCLSHGTCSIARITTTYCWNLRVGGGGGGGGGGGRNFRYTGTRTSNCFQIKANTILKSEHSSFE